MDALAEAQRNGDAAEAQRLTRRLDELIRGSETA